MSVNSTGRRRFFSRPHPWARGIVIFLVSTSLVTLALSLYVYHLDQNITRLSPIEHAVNADPTKASEPLRPMNVLVLGSDTRKGKGNHVAGSTPGLSDTAILLHLSKDRTRAYGVSLPRDAMVERPPCRTPDGGRNQGGLSMFNEAYVVGGAACTVKTVETITGIRMDHVMVIDFNGFKHMVDALGGVRMCVPRQVDDYVGNIHLRAGTYLMDGKTALDYVRVRHNISANGDIGRMKRQQTFVAAMIKKLVSVGTLANPIRLNNFLDAATKSLTTDDQFNVTELATVAKQLKDIGLDRVQFITVPFQEYAPDPNRLQIAPEAAALWQRIKADESLGKRFSGEVVKASDPSKPGTKPNQSSVASQNGLCQ